MANSSPFPLTPCVVVTLSLKKKQLLNLFSPSIASPVLYSFDVIAAPHPTLNHNRWGLVDFKRGAQYCVKLWSQTLALIAALRGVLAALCHTSCGFPVFTINRNGFSCPGECPPPNPDTAIRGGAPVLDKTDSCASVVIYHAPPLLIILQLRSTPHSLVEQGTV